VAIVKLRYRFRFYPTDTQKKTLARTFGACRYVYNWALRLRTDSYHGGKTINYNASSAALTTLKEQEDHAWLNEISCVPTQQALRHLQTAFSNFFEKRTGYPTFKKKYETQSAEYTRSAFRWDAANRNLSLSSIGRLRIRWSRTFKSDPTTVTVGKDRAGRYHVTLVLDEKRTNLPKTGQAIGVDLGINRLATLSNGERIPNPRHLTRQTEKLVRAQRVLSRRTKGSGHWRRAKLRVAKIHAKIADARLDYMNKVTTDLVRRFDTICIEDLNVRGMVKNHNLARSLSDASLGLFGRLIEYKCGWYGKTLKKVDRFFPSSKRCCICGHILESLPLSVREWDCPRCKTHHDRDENAAINILAGGHSVSARGGRIRRDRTSVRKRNGRRSVNQPVVKRA
jgi:putative transposase